MEDALYDSWAMRDFAGIDLGNKTALDESTILQFRHRMEACDFGAELLWLVNVHLADRVLKVCMGYDSDVLAMVKSTEVSIAKL